MPSESDAVKRLQAALDLGFSLSEAVFRTLGQTQSAWAEDHGVRQSEVSMCLGGYPERPYGAIRDALCDDLGIPRSDLDRLIDGTPQKEAVA